MDEKIITEFILTQLASLLTSAENSLDPDHKVITTLEDAIAALTTAAPVIPNGFTAESYDTFLAEQVDAVFENETVDTVRESVTDVVGVIIDEQGTVTEVGDVVASAAAANEVIAAYEEENGEIEVENVINIAYTRLDGAELTVNDVNTIINHPISEPLKHLGAIQLIAIRDTDEIAKKEAVFGVLEEGAISLKQLALGATAYRGVTVLPGLGRVQAIGSTNFA